MIKWMWVVRERVTFRILAWATEWMVILYRDRESAREIYEASPMRLVAGI